MNRDMDDLKKYITEMYEKEEQEFGYGRFYQSFPELGLDGMRSTEERIEKYRFRDYLNPDQDVVDLGCNCGFLDMSISDMVNSVTGIEYNRNLVEIANVVKNKLNKQNASFINCDYNNWIKKNDRCYDVIFSFAVHYWFKVKPENYAYALARIMKPGGLLYFESQDIKADKEYPLFCKEFIYRGMKPVYVGTGTDDGMYERRYYVFRKQEKTGSYFINKLTGKILRRRFEGI